jgi:hypothetical protein
MPRFVILEHDHPFRHWDLMLEEGEVLRTWRLPAPPAVGQTVAAELLGDHRKLYLDYEGPVSRGRGTVQRWDHGLYQPGQDMTPENLVIHLLGQRLRGIAVLRQKADGTWSFSLQASA